MCAQRKIHCCNTMEGLLSSVSWLWALSRAVFFLVFLCLYPCSPAWPLWPPSVWDVPSLCCRIEMGVWGEQVMQKSGEPEWSRHECINVCRRNKDCQASTHTPAFLSAALYVACSGLLRNAEQNHKWTRHTARRYKIQQPSGSCSRSSALVYCSKSIFQGSFCIFFFFYLHWNYNVFTSLFVAPFLVCPSSLSIYNPLM